MHFLILGQNLVKLQRWRSYMFLRLSFLQITSVICTAERKIKVVTIQKLTLETTPAYLVVYQFMVGQHLHQKFVPRKQEMYMQNEGPLLQRKKTGQNNHIHTYIYCVWFMYICLYVVEREQEVGQHKPLNLLLLFSTSSQLS